MTNTENKITKIVVDRNLCIGAASCIVSAGSVFELDGENKAVIKMQGGTKTSGPAVRTALEDPSISDEALMQAAESCPTKALALFDAEGKQVYP